MRMWGRRLTRRNVKSAASELQTIAGKSAVDVGWKSYTLNFLEIEIK
jgi:hypothetical protein